MLAGAQSQWEADSAASLHARQLLQAGGTPSALLEDYHHSANASPQAQLLQAGMRCMQKHAVAGAVARACMCGQGTCIFHKF